MRTLGYRYMVYLKQNVETGDEVHRDRRLGKFGEQELGEKIGTHLCRIRIQTQNRNLGKATSKEATESLG